jgi:hypothetical protein
LEKQFHLTQTNSNKKSTSGIIVYVFVRTNTFNLHFWRHDAHFQLYKIEANSDIAA